MIKESASIKGSGASCFNAKGSSGHCSTGSQQRTQTDCHGRPLPASLTRVLNGRINGIWCIPGDSYTVPFWVVYSIPYYEKRS